MAVKKKQIFKNKRICVYCGSKFGTDPDFKKLCKDMAKQMVAKNYDLVYGGGQVGLMGEISNQVMTAGGKVFGVIPRGLFRKEVAATEVTKLYKVKNMHERKALMEKLSDYFVAIPGGWGTLDEFFEIITWRQIGIHQKPVAILNYKGFFDPLLCQLEKMNDYGFVDQDHFKHLIIAKDVKSLLRKIENSTKA